MYATHQICVTKLMVMNNKDKRIPIEPDCILRVRM
jgi:hypothetical protein